MIIVAQRILKFESVIKNPIVTNHTFFTSTTMFYGDFESTLVPEDNGKQNPEEPYTKKISKTCCLLLGYKLVCEDDKFSRSFKSYFSKDAVYNFINNMMEESKYCSDNDEKAF